MTNQDKIKSIINDKVFEINKSGTRNIKVSFLQESTSDPTSWVLTYHEHNQQCHESFATYDIQNNYKQTLEKIVEWFEEMVKTQSHN